MNQSKINSAVVDDLVEENRLLHQAKRHHDVCLTIKPMSTDDFRFLAFSDASFASPKVPSSHAGGIILGTHKDMANNCTCVISPISWGSRKIQKVVVSTLAEKPWPSHPHWIIYHGCGCTGDGFSTIVVNGKSLKSH